MRKTEPISRRTTTTKTILIADDDQDLLTALTARCERLGVQVLAVEDALTALSAADIALPDLICLDVDMPHGNGLAACEMLASDERFRSTPVIILTGKKDPETIRRCHLLCAHYVAKTSGVWDELSPLICELLEIDDSGEEMFVSDQEQRVDELAAPLPLPFVDHLVSAWAQKDDVSDSDIREDSQSDRVPWLLHVEDDASFSAAIKKRLERHGIAVVRAFDGQEGLETIFDYPPDIVLLDMEMPNGSGDQVLRILKSNPLTAAIPVIVLSGRNDEKLAQFMRNLGAEKYLTKPLRFDLLIDELARHIDVLRFPSGV